MRSLFFIVGAARGAGRDVRTLSVASTTQGTLRFLQVVFFSYLEGEPEQKMFCFIFFPCPVVLTVLYNVCVCELYVYV